MNEIRCVTCGKMTMYSPDGNSLPGELFQLFSFLTGAVVVERTGSIDNVRKLSPDSSLLVEAIRAVTELIGSAPDCACRPRPFINEVCMTDGSYRYAPYDELHAIIENLFRAAGEHEYKLPNPAGAVVSDTVSVSAPDEVKEEMSVQDDLPEITEIRLDHEGTRYDLRIKRDAGIADLSLFLSLYYLTGYRFPASHEALTEMLRAVPELLNGEESPDGKNVVIFSSGGKMSAKPDELHSLFEELIAKLSEDKENVKITESNSMTGLAGAVAYKPSPLEKMGGNTSMAQFKAQTSAAPSAQNHPVTFYENGSWDCSCGAKGLTTRFCINCGAPKLSSDQAK